MVLAVGSYRLTVFPNNADQIECNTTTGRIDVTI